MIERGGFVAEHVRTHVDETLVLDQPFRPLAVGVERRDRPRIVWHGTSRDGNELVKPEVRRLVPVFRSVRSLEAEPPPRTQIETTGRRPAGRPVVVGLPGVLTGSEADDLGNPDGTRRRSPLHRLESKLLVQFERTPLQVM